jgi:NADPH-dependent glutamate synthase beta subunit-like oxidoreductase
MFETGVTSGVEMQLNELRKDFYAVFLRREAQNAKPLDIPSAELRRVQFIAIWCCWESEFIN